MATFLHHRHALGATSIRALAVASIVLGAAACQWSTADNRRTPLSTPTLSTWPNSIEGRVLEVDGATLFIESGNETFRLTSSAATLIWDGIPWVANVPTKAGDFVIAEGIWKRDHSFDARKLYVNIVNLQGRASDVSRQGDGATFLLADQYQQSDAIAISPLTEIYEGSTGARSLYGQNPVLPANGVYAEVIGRKMADGSVLAVNITLSP